MGHNYEEAYLKDMRNKCKEVDLNPYCIKMNDQGKRVGSQLLSRGLVHPMCGRVQKHIITMHPSISFSGSSNSKRSSTQYYGSWKEEHDIMAVLFRYISYFHVLLAYIRS